MKRNTKYQSGYECDVIGSDETHTIFQACIKENCQLYQECKKELAVKEFAKHYNYQSQWLASCVYQR